MKIVAPFPFVFAPELPLIGTLAGAALTTLAATGDGGFLSRLFFTGLASLIVLMARRGIA